MPKLTDTQLIVLATAAKRDDGSLLPLPKKLKLNDDTKSATLKKLIRQKLAAEQPVAAGAAGWREEDGQRLMLTITPAGLRAIGVQPSDGAPGGVPIVGRTPSGKGRKVAARASKTPGTSTARLKSDDSRVGAQPGTKQAKLIERLRRPKGASIAEMMKATGWQAHSVRGVMSGALKKKLGLAIVSEKNDGGERRYRIAG